MHRSQVALFLLAGFVICQVAQPAATASGGTGEGNEEDSHQWTGHTRSLVSQEGSDGGEYQKNKFGFYGL